MNDVTSELTGNVPSNVGTSCLTAASSSSSRSQTKLSKTTGIDHGGSSMSNVTSRRLPDVA